jgi:hypothetical protein
MLKKIKGKLVAVPAALSMALMSGAVFAQSTGVDTTEIEAAISDVQVKGIKIAGLVTVMIFLIAGAKWLRRAK